MTAIEYHSEANLKELQSQLTHRLTLLLIGVASLMILFTMRRWPFPIVPFSISAALLGLGWGVRALLGARPVLARHLLVWGLTAGLLVAMGLFRAPGIPFLGLLLAFVGTMLVRGGGIVTGGATAALAAWLTYRGIRTYPLAELCAALAVDVVLAHLVMHTLYTALEWAWAMQQRADQLLEVARDHQGELKRVLKSLNLSNTLLHRTQRDLSAARKKAEEARLMKEQFAANISHELRTPLNLILGFSEIMSLSSEVYGHLDWPPALRRDINQIYRSSRHLLQMIDDVLDLSRFELAGFKLEKEPTWLEPLVRETVEMSRDLFQGRPIRLEVDIAQGLPMLEIDRIRIRQVLLNLLNNASRFTNEGVVRVQARCADGEVLISVGDTGPGIPADKLPHIFDEFYQVDPSLHRKHGGTGLGLAISKRFVEAHEGRIWVESQEGVGSTFHFALPIPGHCPPLLRPHMDHAVEDYVTSWSEPILHDCGKVDHLQLDWESPYLKKLHELTDAFLEVGKDKFITGMTDWHPGGDCLAALRDPQNLALDMALCLEKVKATLPRLEADYFAVYDIFYEKLRAADQPISTWLTLVCEEKFYVTSNDFSIMISKAMFDDVFLPGIARECQFLDRSIYHLDGPGALRHLDSILAIPDLDALQFVPGAGNEGFHKWVKVYKRAQAAGKAIQVYCRLAEVDQVMESLDPRGLYLSINEVPTREAAEALLRKLEQWCATESKLRQA